MKIQVINEKDAEWAGLPQHPELEEEDGDGDGEVWLTVAEFCAQPEVDKYPSQVYGWMKKGLPWEELDGKKMIPLQRGLVWMAAWSAKRDTARPKRGYKYQIVEGVPDGEERGTYQPKVALGDFLRWERGNGLGHAYGKIVKFAGTLACVQVEYRTNTVYLPKDQLTRDIAKGVVKVVHETEVGSFLLTEIARLEFFTYMLRGKEHSSQVKKTLLEFEIVPPDFAERMHESTARKWPSEDDLISCASCGGAVGPGEEEGPMYVCTECGASFITKGEEKWLGKSQE